MTVLGFNEVQKATVSVTLDDEIEFDVVNLIGIFLLKIVAWRDRNQKVNKDADDLLFILKNYLNINLARAVEKHYEEVYEIENYTELKASASIIGIDLKELVKDNQKLIDFLINTLNLDLEKEKQANF